ncbi:MAG: hypothetical protein ACOC4E_00835 [Patescibacteria group bacterium]
MIENMPGQPSWQDIHVEEIHRFIAEEKYSKAKLFTQIRKAGLEAALADIDDVLNKPEQARTHTLEEWQEQRRGIEEELVELRRLEATLDHDLGSD